MQLFQFTVVYVALFSLINKRPLFPRKIILLLLYLVVSLGLPFELEIEIVSHGLLPFQFNLLHLLHFGLMTFRIHFHYVVIDINV